MPSVTKNRPPKSSLKSKLKSKVAQLKKAGKALLARNGKNGHSNGVRLGAKTVIKGAAAKLTAKEPAIKAGKVGKRVYFFGGAKAEGNKEMKNLLGGKGANLAEMANIGLPVPPGFTITTEVCTEFYANGKKLPKQLDADIHGAVARMEKLVGAKFGDPVNPLLVSVRSGARASMPGMMDTILNLGLNDETVQGLAKSSGDDRFAFDSYRRFIQMYSDVVLGIDKEHFEHELFALRDRAGVKTDAEIPAKGLQELIETYKKIVTDNKQQFPQKVEEQLWGAIG